MIIAQTLPDLSHFLNQEVYATPNANAFSEEKDKTKRVSAPDRADIFCLHDLQIAIVDCTECVGNERSSVL
jgi:hypothetical protein